MRLNPENITNWFGQKGKAYLAWDERRTKARQEKMRKDHHTLEICIALCGLLIVLGLMTHVSGAALRSVCVLAAIIVILKFWQLAIIFLHHNGNTDE